MMVFAIFFQYCWSIGDLIESAMNRHFGVKTQGIIPGHGGVLDRFDSMLAVFQLCTYLAVLRKGEQILNVRLLTFILVLGLLWWFTSSAISILPRSPGIWFVNLPLVWVPKSLPILGKTGLLIRFVSCLLGGYVRMAGWGDDTTEIKTGTPVSLTLP